MRLSALAQHLADHVAAASRQRTDLGTLYGVAVAFDRSMATAPSARTEIRDALDELVAIGAVTYPNNPRLFDTRDEPPLPMWIKRPPRDGPVPERRTARVWPSALETAGRIARGADQIKVLETIAAFLRDGASNRPSVPMKERSIELFRDEKKLDALLTTRLFTSGALTLELLRCHRVPIPFVSQWVPGADDLRGAALLVAENHHTYTSLLKVTRENAAVGGPGRHVGYGTGNQFPSAVLSASLLLPKPDRIVYFGDMDLKGLKIPATASDAATRAELPTVVPALPLYELLFDLSYDRPAAPVPANDAAQAAAWLGPLADRARNALVNGIRFPQEAVGYERLTGDRYLLDNV